MQVLMLLSNIIHNLSLYSSKLDCLTLLGILNSFLDLFLSSKTECGAVSLMCFDRSPLAKNLEKTRALDCIHEDDKDDENEECPHTVGGEGASL
jgi:hypothetical protein